MRVGEKGAMAVATRQLGRGDRLHRRQDADDQAEHGAEAVAFGRGTGINNTHIVSRLANLFGSPNVTAIALFLLRTARRRVAR